MSTSSVEVDTTIARLMNFIEELRQSLEVVSTEISLEERATRVFERSDLRYSPLAKSLCTRRDNLTSTIGQLEEQLRTLKSETSAAR